MADRAHDRRRPRRARGELHREFRSTAGRTRRSCWRPKACRCGGAYRDVSLQMRAGEVLGIYGFMGCGQLELARTLFGKLRPDARPLRLDGRPRAARAAPRAARQAGIAFVPESRRSMLFAPGAGLQEHLDQHPRAHRRACFCRPDGGAPHRRAKVDAAAHPARLGRARAAHALGRQPAEGGAGPWLTHLPKVLVLSEPTRGMDVGAKDDVVQIVRGLQEQGIGVVVVSTEPETVLALADRILVMRKGEIVARVRRRDWSARTACSRRHESTRPLSEASGQHRQVRRPAPRRPAWRAGCAASCATSRRSSRCSSWSSFFSVASPSFATVGNLANILRQVSITGDHRDRADLRHPLRRDRPVGRRHRQCRPASWSPSSRCRNATSTSPTCRCRAGWRSSWRSLACVRARLRQRLRRHAHRHPVLHHDAGHAADRRRHLRHAGARPDRLCRAATRSRRWAAARSGRCPGSSSSPRCSCSSAISC